MRSKEYRMSCVNITFRCDATADQLIDVIEGNRMCARPYRSPQPAAPPLSSLPPFWLRSTLSPPLPVPTLSTLLAVGDTTLRAQVSNECRVFCLFPKTPDEIVTDFCNAWTRSDVEAILGA